MTKMLLKKLISQFLRVMEVRRRKWSRNFSNGPGTKSFVPQGEGRALRARKRGKILVRPSRTRRQWLTNHKLENGGKWLSTGKVGEKAGSAEGPRRFI